MVLACSSTQPRLDGRAKEARRHMTHVLSNMLSSHPISLDGSVKQYFVLMGSLTRWLCLSVLRDGIF